jgi:hypothetical protein
LDQNNYEKEELRIDSTFPKFPEILIINSIQPIHKKSFFKLFVKNLCFTNIVEKLIIKK